MKKNSNIQPPRLALLMTAGCAIIFSAIAFIIEPVYIFINSDVLTSTTFLPRVLDLLCDLCDIGAFAFCYGLIIFAAVTRSTKAAWGLFGIYIFACALRRGLVLLISYIIYSYVSDFDLVGVGSVFAIECTIALFVTLLSVAVGGTYRRNRATQKVARVTGDPSGTEGTGLFTVFSKNEPLLVCALITAAVMTLIKLGMRIISDIGYGAPTSAAEILIMVIYYLFDILLCVLLYAAMWLLFSKLLSRLGKQALK